MELNATFYAQLVQFWVLWGVVRYVFVRPVLRLVIAENKRLNGLVSKVEAAETRVIDRTRHNEQEWELLARRLREQRPRGAVGEQELPIEIVPHAAEQGVARVDVDVLADQLVRTVVRNGEVHD